MFHCCLCLFSLVQTSVFLINSLRGCCGLKQRWITPGKIRECPLVAWWCILLWGHHLNKQSNGLVKEKKTVTVQLTCNGSPWHWFAVWQGIQGTLMMIIKNPLLNHVKKTTCSSSGRIKCNVTRSHDVLNLPLETTYQINQVWQNNSKKIPIKSHTCSGLEEQNKITHNSLEIEFKTIFLWCTLVKVNDTIKRAQLCTPYIFYFFSNSLNYITISSISMLLPHRVIPHF